MIGRKSDAAAGFPQPRDRLAQNTLARVWSGTRPADDPRSLCLRRLLDPGRNADRTAHAGAAQTAISHRVLRQVLLVVVLGKIERRRIDDLGGDGIEAARLELLVVHRLRRLRGFALLGRERIDAGAILRADVVALAHALRGVVARPERLEQALIGDLLGSIDPRLDLVVAGPAG